MDKKYYFVWFSSRSLKAFEEMVIKKKARSMQGYISKSLFAKLYNSRYVRIVFLRKKVSSCIAALFAASNNLYLMVKWLVAVATISSLQNATIEANIWFAWDRILFVGDLVRLVFSLIDLIQIGSVMFRVIRCKV